MIQRAQLLLIVPLLTQVTLTISQNSPTVEGCRTCERTTGLTYKLECFSHTDHFSITCNPFMNYLTVKCNNEAVLDRFHVQDHNFTRFIKKLHLEDCQFQSNVTIGSFVEKLGLLKNLEEIVLISPTFLSPVTAGHFDNLQKISLLSVRNWTVNSTLPNHVFDKTSGLVFLFLQRLDLRCLRHDVFNNLNNLTVLDLAYNDLKFFKSNPFSKLVNLKKLRLAYNKVKFINEKALMNLKRLEVLDLSHNNLTAISRTFSGLQKLRQLDLSHNRLSVIDQDVFINLVNLKILDLSHNELRQLDSFTGGSQSIFHHCRSIVELILNHNKITKMYLDWLDFKHLRVLSLQKNKITEIFSENLAFKSTNVYLNLMQNHIKTIRIDPEYLLTVINSNPEMINVLADFSFNPVRCDCQMYNLTRYFENKLVPDIKRVFHFVATHLECNQPYFLKGVHLSDVESKDLLCLVDYDYSNHCVYFWSPEYKVYLNNCSNKNHSGHQRRMKELQEALLENYPKMLPSKL